MAEALRLNRRLAWLPRLKIRRRADVLLIQAILRLSQMGGNRRLRRAGLLLERRWAEWDGNRVALRILRPAGPVRGVVLDIHGGGWVLGNARVDDAVNAAAVQACGVATVSVDYRLVWHTSIDAAIADCVTAARWLLEGGLPEYAGLPVVVAGESAGAQLAAAMLQRLRDWPGLLPRIAGALLFYGVYDFTGTPSVRAAGSDTLILHGPGLVADLRRLTADLDDAERASAPLSPLHGDLGGMPPALMVVGALDPLRDDTLLMAARWREAASVELHLVPASPHGFIHFRTRLAHQVLRRTQAWITERLAAPPSAAAGPGAGTGRSAPG